MQNPNRPPGWPDPGLTRECKPDPAPPAPPASDLQPVPTRRELQALARTVDVLLMHLINEAHDGQRITRAQLQTLREALHASGLLPPPEATRWVE